MARVTMYRLALNAASTDEAKELVNQVLDGTVFGAKALTAPGTGPYTTGHLASTIHKEGPHVTGRLVTGSVVATAPYAQIAHDGSPIHEIYPKGEPHVYRFGSRKAKQLKFLWHGRTVYTPHVPMSPGKIGLSHPGYKGKKFLSIPLRAMARLYGFRYMDFER